MEVGFTPVWSSVYIHRLSTVQHLFFGHAIHFHDCFRESRYQDPPVGVSIKKAPETLSFGVSIHHPLKVQVVCWSGLTEGVADWSGPISRSVTGSEVNETIPHATRHVTQRKPPLLPKTATTHTEPARVGSLLEGRYSSRSHHVRSTPLRVASNEPPSSEPPDTESTRIGSDGSKAFLAAQTEWVAPMAASESLGRAHQMSNLSGFPTARRF